MQGNYIEVGINFNGAYGSSVSPPSVGYCGSSYHPKGGNAVYNSDSSSTTGSCPSTTCGIGGGLGFVADPDKDGWTVGTPYPYYGDYFLPGTPHEGWSIEADGVQVNQFNAWGCSTSICGLCAPAGSIPAGSGHNISYTTSGAIVTAVWQGIWNGLQITQTTTLDTSQTFFITAVVIKNIGFATHRNIYYQRCIDPDNAEAETGSFITKNRIEYQLPNAAHKVLISSWGTDAAGTSIIPSSYLGLGTMDTNAKAYLTDTSGLMPPIFENMDSLYGRFSSISSIPGGGDTSAVLMHQGDSIQLDRGIGLVFKLGDLGVGDTVRIAYAYAFKRGVDLDSALVSTINKDTINHHAGINTTKNKGNLIQAYPNPLKNELTLSALSVDDNVMVYDMMGRKVLEWLITKDGNNTFDTKELQTGMYILRVIDKRGSIKANLPVRKQ